MDKIMNRNLHLGARKTIEKKNAKIPEAAVEKCTEKMLWTEIKILRDASDYAVRIFYTDTELITDNYEKKKNTINKTSNL